MNKKSILFLQNLLLIFALAGNPSIAQRGKIEESGSTSKKTISKTNNLSFQRWSLIEINGLEVEKARAFLEFNLMEKRFAGNAGCNQMFGKFEAIGSTIKLSDIGSTRMFCATDGVMKLESDFLKALKQATGFEQKDNLLNLFAGDNLILKFSGAAKVDSGKGTLITVKLEGKKWILVSISGKPLPKIEKTPFLIFNKWRASAGGDSGCNSYGGSYKTEGDKISITEIRSTKRACIEEKQTDVERELLDGLKRTKHFEIKAGKLNLYEGDSSC